MRTCPTKTHKEPTMHFCFYCRRTTLDPEVAGTRQLTSQRRRGERRATGGAGTQDSSESNPEERKGGAKSQRRATGRNQNTGLMQAETVKRRQPEGSQKEKRARSAVASEVQTTSHGNSDFLQGQEEPKRKASNDQERRTLQRRQRRRWTLWRQVTRQPTGQEATRSEDEQQAEAESQDPHKTPGSQGPKSEEGRGQDMKMSHRPKQTHSSHASRDCPKRQLEGPREKQHGRRQNTNVSHRPKSSNGTRASRDCQKRQLEGPRKQERHAAKGQQAQKELPGTLSRGRA